MMMMAGNAMASPDGSFQIPNVAPGRYMLNLRPNGHAGRRTTSLPSLPITVGNDDIDNVMVSTSVGATARGVVVTDTGEAPTFRPDQVQLFASPPEPMMMPIGNSAPTRVNEDFSFEMTSLFDRRDHARVDHGRDRAGT